MKPISPSEVVDKKLTLLPDEVIDATNELIADNWNGNKATFKQKELVARIQKKYEAADKYEITKEEVYERRYLDIEDIYRAQGWNVAYDKPGFNETWYEPQFIFTKK